MTEQTKPYPQSLYEDFMAKYKSSVVGAEEIGELIAKMGQFFGDAVRTLAIAENAFDKKLAEIQQQDENGKPISSTKAEIYANASEEGFGFKRSKREVEVIDKQIMTLQSFQKGVMAEFSHSSKMG